MERINSELIDFIHSSPTPYHAVKNASVRLVEDGYTELYENDLWTLEVGGKYFVRRGETSLIAFRVPSDAWEGYGIVASHTDSPSFKLKPSFELFSDNYLRLSADKYGGAVLSSWLDRPLHVAGRLVISNEKGVTTRLVETPAPVAIIPSLAPHMKKEDSPLSMNGDMCALISGGGHSGEFFTELCNIAMAEEKDVVSHDLYLVNNQKGLVWGASGDFVSAPRLDDLQCVFSSLVAFLLSSDEENIPVLAFFDREEVGSESANGGASMFLPSVLERVSDSLGRDRGEHLRALSSSFFISADNAHGVHPNHPETADSLNRGYLNSGIAIKHNAMGRYVTDAVSSSVIKSLCEHAGCPVFDYTNRADMPGGSTLGHIMQTHLSIPGADIGLPELAMHSSFETAGARDTEYAVRLFTAFFTSRITPTGNGYNIQFLD